MFRQRVITSAMIVPLVIAILFSGLPGLQFGFGMLLLAVSGWEWTRLIALSSRPVAVTYCVVVLLFSALAVFYPMAPWWWFWLAVLSWTVIIMAILTYPASQRLWGYPAVVAIAGLLLLPLFMYALTAIITRPVFGAALLMYTIVLVWAADVGAYLAGRRYGQHKLIPRVSPGKSWEGVLGGLMLVSLVALAGAAYFKPPTLVCWYVGALLLALQSIFGDLFISMLKRRQQLKDTGQILPGHGGMLDRLDSLLAVTPLAAILYSYCLSY
ncbi:MAG: phosphatidate cytidylyltransferase [Legionellaceae bacterium]|nr:phosphatidate cytidylyltransferase [Legionellaceae bacterium]